MPGTRNASAANARNSTSANMIPRPCWLLSQSAVIEKPAAMKAARQQNAPRMVKITDMIFFSDTDAPIQAMNSMTIGVTIPRSAVRRKSTTGGAALFGTCGCIARIVSFLAAALCLSDKRDVLQIQALLMGTALHCVAVRGAEQKQKNSEQAARAEAVEDRLNAEHIVDQSSKKRTSQKPRVE